MGQAYSTSFLPLDATKNLGQSSSLGFLKGKSGRQFGEGDQNLKYH